MRSVCRDRERERENPQTVHLIITETRADRQTGTKVQRETRRENKYMLTCKGERENPQTVHLNYYRDLRETGRRGQRYRETMRKNTCTLYRQTDRQAETERENRGQ